MVGISESVWLNARPERVWSYIVEPEKLAQWLTEMHHIEWQAEGPIRVGSRYAVDKEIRGHVRRYRCEVTQFEENRLFGFTSEAPGFSCVEGGWELVPEGNGCRLAMRETITTHTGWLIERLFVQPGASRALRGFQARLKQLLEGQDV